jgi:Zn-dependent peptidase ImmA (M78 family)
MGLPSNFIKSIPDINKIIRYTEAHRDIRYPVDIDRILKKLNIEVVVKPFEDDILEGYCSRGNMFGFDRKIYINENKPVEVRRKGKAHELHHMTAHGKYLPLYSHIDQEDKILEREANYAAAYYLVPGKCIKLALEWGMKFEELAEKLCVPVDLVFKRYDIFLALKEFHNEEDMFKHF